MAVNKISLNSVEAQNVSQVTILPATPVDDVVNQFDIFYHLGTDLQQTTWTSPLGTDVSITHTGPAITSGAYADLINRDQTGFIEFTAPDPAVALTFEFLNNFEVDLQSYIVANSSSTGVGITGWIVEGSTDNSNWVQLDQVSGAATGVSVEDLYYCESRHGFFKYIRFRNIIWSDTANPRIGELLFFGRLRNLVTGQAAIENTKDIFASYPSVDAPARYENSIIRYDGTYWEPRLRFPYEVIKLVLTGDHTITSAYKPTFYVISPNGANRTITLPTSPATDDVVKIKNLDGAFDLTVEEFVGDPSPVVMNNAGKLQYEFVYDGVEWQVSG